VSILAIVFANPVEAIPKDIPGIIREAAKSNLGIFALMLLIIAAIAYAFFKSEKITVKVPIFAVLVIGVVAFGIATITSANTVNYSISGKVYEADTQKRNSPRIPIDQATVTIQWGKISQPTDSMEDGSYSFIIEQDARSIPKELNLSADKEGYVHYSYTVHDPFYKTPQNIKMQKNDGAKDAPRLSADSARSPVSCNLVSSSRSVNSGTETQIQFHNSTTQLIQIFWIDYDGRPQFWGELQPATFTTFNTYADHPWEVRTVTGQCLGVFIPQSREPLLADVNGRPS
jgi:hypothetical protein